MSRTKRKPRRRSPRYWFKRPAGAKIPKQKADLPIKKTRGLFASSIKHKRKLKVQVRDWLTGFFVLSLWGGLLFLVLKISPDSWWVIAGFLTLFFFAVWLSFLRFAKSGKIGFFLAFFLTFILVLLIFRQFHWLNLLLLTAFCFALFRMGKGTDSKN